MKRVTDFETIDIKKLTESGSKNNIVFMPPFSMMDGQLRNHKYSNESKSEKKEAEFKDDYSLNSSIRDTRQGHPLDNISSCLQKANNWMEEKLRYGKRENINDILESFGNHFDKMTLFYHNEIDQLESKAFKLQKIVNQYLKTIDNSTHFIREGQSKNVENLEGLIQKQSRRLVEISQMSNSYKLK